MNLSNTTNMSSTTPVAVRSSLVPVRCMSYTLTKLTPLFAKHSPMPFRLGKPQEIAAMVNFLAGSEAGYITGSSFVVDGG
jgi:NAD(P)-dependent dehydrogenase (short-subunit alcohol dehydrogenase family)